MNRERRIRITSNRLSIARLILVIISQRWRAGDRNRRATLLTGNSRSAAPQRRLDDSAPVKRMRERASSRDARSPSTLASRLLDR